MFGTLIAQLVPVLGTVIFAKLYQPEDLGLFQTYFGYSMVLSVLVTMRYEMAIILPDKKSDALQLMYLCLGVGLALTVLQLIVFFLFENSILELIGGIEMKGYLFLLPFTVFIIGISQVLNYWCNREEEYKLLASNRIFRAVYSLSTSISLFKFKALGLILGDTIGQLLSVLSISFLLKRKNKIQLVKPDYATIKHLAHRYSQFPFFNVPSGLLEKVSSNLPSLIFLSFFSPSILGYFALTQRIIGLPGALIARAYGDVFRQQASIIYRKEKNCKALFIKTFKALVFIAIPLFVLLFFMVQPAFDLVFGEKWKIAGVFAQYLMPMFFLQFIVSPLSSMFLVAEKQKADLILQICLLLSLLTSFFIGIKLHFNADKIIICFGIVYCFKYLVELYLSYKFSKTVYASNE